ncbi:MAG: hypothetical protein ACF8XB_12295, partial [Planctomycetota bacterium JB042]
MRRPARRAAGFLVAGLGALAPSSTAETSGGLESWPVLSHLDLEIDLSRPPRFVGRARATFERVELPSIPFLLNSSLALTSVRA